MAEAQIVAVDTGHGITNSATFSGAKGTLKTDMFPSVRAKAYGQNLGLGIGHEMQYTTVDFDGERYVFGEDVVNVTDTAKERHHGQNRAGGEFQAFLVACALLRLKVPSGPVHLILFAPPKWYEKSKKMINDFFPRTLELKASNQAKPKVWEIVTLDVIPEGFGVISSTLFNNKGEHVGSDIFDGIVMTVDVGLYTFDAVVTVDGGFNSENLRRATFDNQGVHTHVLEPILEEVRLQENFEGATIDHIEIALRHPERKVIIGTWQLPIGNLFRKYFKRYANWIANTLETNFNGLVNINRLIFIGGSAKEFDEYFNAWYPSKMFDLSRNALTRDIHPVFFNAIGGLRYTNYEQKEIQRRMKLKE